MNRRLTAFFGLKTASKGCRSKAKPLILLPITMLLAVSVSGCTGISGIDSLFGGFCIPGIGTCGQTVEYASDILVITTLSAVPDTISTGQQIRLSAWIVNNGGETVPQSDFEGTPVKVNLYDTCSGLFKKITVNCPNSQGGHEEESTSCQISSILPKQTVPVSWTLVANDKDKIPLETSCNLKVYVQYPYRTKSITSITFVDYVEYQRMLDENKFTPITSYLTVEDQQPIPVTNGIASTTTMAFQIKNKGSGFLIGSFDSLPYSAPGAADTAATTTPKIPPSAIKIQSNAGTGQGDYQNKIVSDIVGAVNKMDGFQLIGTESPKQFFTVNTPYNNQIEKTATYYVSSSIDYMYEFRKEIKITIKPPAISG
jgi:hypothetical protein